MNYVYVLIICHGVLFTSTYGSRANNETRFNNCLTWRDNQTTLVLTCHVDNFLLPVTFIHKKSNTRVKCYIGRKHTHCPKDGNRISIDKYKHTVTIELYVQKLRRNLGGNWHCKQGKRTQTTEVSLSTGIIIDSWVQFVGKTIFENGTQYLLLECSSCRTPQWLYVEFLINDITKASIWLDDHGHCVHKNKNCSDTMCACSLTGNMFSFRLRVKDLQTAVNLSCDMIFMDDLRKDRFSTAAITTYTGKDFIVTENETVVITPKTKISKDPEKERTTKQNSGNVPLEVILPTVISLIGIIIAVCLAVYKYKCIKKGGKGRGIGEEHEMETLLNKVDKCKNCADRIKARQADLTCFECRQCFCHTCHERVHCTSEELKQHTYVETSKVPKEFFLSIFNCLIEGHQNLILDHICTNHDTFICKICRTTIHEECVIDIVSTIQAKEVNEKAESCLLEMLDLKGQLTAFEYNINKSVKVAKLHRRQVNQHIDGSSEILFSLMEEGKTIKTNLKKDDIKEKIHSIVNGLNEEKRKLKPEIAKIQEKIEMQEENVNFISKYGQAYHQKILLSSLKTKLDEIRSMILNNKESFNPIRMEFDREAGIVRITKEHTKDTQSYPFLDTVDNISTNSSRTRALEDVDDETLEMKNACVEKPTSTEVAMIHSPKAADDAKKTRFTEETREISPRLIDKI